MVHAADKEVEFVDFLEAAHDLDAGRANVLDFKNSASTFRNYKLALLINDHKTKPPVMRAVTGH
jgi:hypothetical protein